MSIETFTKDPSALLPYSIDWSAWLVADTIATSAWTVSGPDSSLTIADSSNSTTVSTVELSGGTASRVYTVTNRVTTAAGWIDDRSLTILVENR